MSNELKKSEPFTLFTDTALDDGKLEDFSAEFYTGNYNTLKLYVYLSFTSIPPPIQFDVILINPITLTEHTETQQAQCQVTVDEANQNPIFCIELRCNSSYKAKLRIKVTGIVAPEQWIASVTGYLVEETSAPTTVFI